MFVPAIGVKILSGVVDWYNCALTVRSVPSRVNPNTTLK